MSSSIPHCYFSLSAECPKYLPQSKPLYERKAVTRLWNRLTDVSKKQWKWKNVRKDAKTERAFAGESTSRVLQVFGPPGSGKSCATYSWVEHICRTLSVKAVWLSCANQDGKCWSIQPTEGAAKVVATTMPVPTKADDYEDAMVVIFDGIRETTVETWRPLMNDIARMGVAAIAVSSEGVKFHEGDSSDIMKPEHIVTSWSLAEYTAACSDDAFWAACYNKIPGATKTDGPTRRQELLREKFAIAGHSARFMFNLYSEQAESIIKGEVQRMGGISTLEDAARHTRCTGAINTLVARLQGTAEDGNTVADFAVFPTQIDTQAVATAIEDLSPTFGEFQELSTVPRIVSKFAAEKMVAELPSDVERLRGIARKLDNRAIEGFAFEEQLKKSLVEAQSTPGANLTVRNVDGVAFPYPVENLIRCDTSEIVDILKSSVTPDTWIFIAGRQGAFDAVHVVSRTHLRFLQGTVGKRHSFRLDLIETLLGQLDNTGLTHIEFVVLRPESERRKAFSLDHADGGNQLRLLKRFDEQHWSSADFYRVNAQYAFLQWTHVI